MYRVSIQQDFIAQHYMIGGDWGAESDPHSHHYVIELELSGRELNRDGQLVNTDDLLENLEQRLEYFQDQLLNDLPPFEGVNPTLENFARILCEEINKEVYDDTVDSIMVRLWDSESSWSSYQMEH